MEQRNIKTRSETEATFPCGDTGDTFHTKRAGWKIIPPFNRSANQDEKQPRKSLGFKSLTTLRQSPLSGQYKLEDFTVTALEIPYLFITTSDISVITASKAEWKLEMRAQAGEGHESSRRVSGQAGAYLGCHEVCRVTRSHEKTVLSPQLLGKAKVTNANAFRVS